MYICIIYFHILDILILLEFSPFANYSLFKRIQSGLIVKNVVYHVPVMLDWEEGRGLLINFWESLPEWMTRRIAVPHHQVCGTVLGLCSGHVELEHWHPHFIPGTATGAGLAVRRISSGREASWCGLKVIPTCRVLRKWVVRCV